MALKKGLYQHYKGPLYRVTDIAQHSEDEEMLVIYQALYGDKGMWARPLSMFTEMVEVAGQLIPRFAYCEQQSVVLEVARLDVKPQSRSQFEAAFAQAQTIIQSMPGYLSHDLQHCLEDENRYVLLVQWQTLEDHTVGFRESAQYQQWKVLLHHFYDPFPVVEHYQPLALIEHEKSNPRLKGIV